MSRPPARLLTRAAVARMLIAILMAGAGLSISLLSHSLVYYCTTVYLSSAVESFLRVLECKNVENKTHVNVWVCGSPLPAVLRLGRPRRTRLCLGVVPARPEALIRYHSCRLPEPPATSSSTPERTQC